jgi:hypothetical protein
VIRPRTHNVKPGRFAILKVASIPHRTLLEMVPEIAVMQYLECARELPLLLRAIARWSKAYIIPQLELVFSGESSIEQSPDARSKRLPGVIMLLHNVGDLACPSHGNCMQNYEVTDGMAQIAQLVFPVGVHCTQSDFPILMS